jgi:hypothetical protein
MVEAGDAATSPTCTWIRRGAYLARKIRNGVDPYQAEREIRDELINGLPFQYIGIDGRPYRDLPSRFFWDDAEFGSDDSVVWPKETVGKPLTGPFAHVAERIRETNMAVDVAVGRRLPLRRQLNVYQLEVWVPTEAVSAPATAPATTSVQPKAPPKERPPPEPPPEPPLDWLKLEYKKKKLDESDAKFAERIERPMALAHSAKKVTKAWVAGTIANNISKHKSWLLTDDSDDSRSK